MCFLLLRFCCKKLKPGIGPYYGSTKGDIGDESMQIDWVPQRPLHNLPDIPHHCTHITHPGWGHHEGGPGVSHKHQSQPYPIEHHPQREVDPLFVTITEYIPAIVVDIEEEALKEKEHRIDQHLCPEHLHHVAHKGWIEQEEGNRQGSTKQRSNGVGGDTDLHELMGHIIIALITGFETHKLNTDHKHRYRQHQRPKEEVHLCDNPHNRPTTDPYIWIIATIWLRS